MSTKMMKGLAGIDSAPLPVAGGIPATADLVFIGNTEKDQAKVTEADPTETEFYANETDDPIDSDITGGKKTLEFTLFDVAEANLLAWLGGTVSGTGATTTWNSPGQKATFEKSFRVRSKDGQYLIFPRVKFAAKVDYDLSNKGFFKVAVKGTILTPTGTGIASMVKGTLSV